MTIRHSHLPPQGGSIADRLMLLRNNTQSINNAAATTVLWDNVVIQDTSCYSYNAGTGIITILKTGWYQVTANIQWTTNTFGGRLTNGVKNDGVLTLYVNFGVPSLVDYVTLSFLTRYVAGGTLSHAVYQTSGGALTIAGGNSCVQTMLRLRDL